MMRVWILLFLVFLTVLPTMANEKKKTRIALGDFKMGMIQGQRTFTKQEISGIENSLLSSIRASLFKTKKFEFLERKSIDAVLNEINMQYETGMFDPGATVEFGALRGAEYLVMGTIVAFGQENRGMGLGGLGRQKKKMLIMEIELRIIDVRTGKYLFLDKVMSEKLVGQGTDLGILRTQQSGSTFGDNADLASSGSNIQTEMGGISVLSDLISSAARTCVRQIVLVSNPIKIMRVNQNQLYLNYGDEILSVGDILDVCGEGEPLIDPDTGQVLAIEPIIIGKARVVEASRTYSVAKLLEGTTEGLKDRDDLFCRPSQGKKKGWTPFKKKKRSR